MIVGAYGFYDSIAAQAKSLSANIAYTLPVSLGPISQLQFYNDYGMIYDKSDNSRDTIMNTTGVAVSAGNFFSYIDFVNAKINLSSEEALQVIVLKLNNVLILT